MLHWKKHVSLIDVFLPYECSQVMFTSTGYQRKVMGIAVSFNELISALNLKLDMERLYDCE